MKNNNRAESEKDLDAILNLSLKQIKDKYLSVDAKEVIAGYLEPLLEKWRQEKDEMTKLKKGQGSNMCSDVTVSTNKPEYSRNQAKDNVNREAGDFKYEDKKAVGGELFKNEDKEAAEVSKCPDSTAGDASKCTDREAIDASKYETCYSPSTGLYCFQATSKIQSYQFTVGDAAVITRVISPLINEVIIMNKVRKLRRSTIQIGALVEGGVQQLEEVIYTANDVLGREKGFQFSPIDNSKDIFSVLGRKDEIPRVDANGVYQLQVKFNLDDIKTEDKARAAAEMGRRLERILENVLVEKICRGPGERMLLFSHTSDFTVAKRKLMGCPEFIVAPSKHVWTPSKMEVPVDMPNPALKPDDEMGESVYEKKTVVSLLLTDKRKNKIENLIGICDADKDVSCHGRRVNIIFKKSDLVLSFFQYVNKMDTKMWGHCVLISLEELGSQLIPSIAEEQMMRLAGDKKGSPRDLFDTPESLTVSTVDEKLIFSFESVDSANAFIFSKSRNKKLINSLGQLKRTCTKDDNFALVADEDGFYTLQGPLDKFHAELLSDNNFQDFKITSSSDYKKVYISFPTKVSMFHVLLGQSARQMGLVLNKKHFVKVNASQKSESVDAVNSLVQEIVKAALNDINQIVVRPNDDNGSMDSDHNQSFESGKVFVKTIGQVETDDEKFLFSDVEKEPPSKPPQDVANSSVKTLENYQDAYLRFDKSIDIVQTLIREIFEQVFVGKEHKTMECSNNLSCANTDFEDKRETSVDKKLTLMKESSNEDVSQDNERLKQNSVE